MKLISSPVKTVGHTGLQETAEGHFHFTGCSVADLTE